MPTLLAFLFSLLLLSCGKDTDVSPIAKDKLAALYQQKLEELRIATAGHEAGWPSDHDCDAALWAGVARAAGAEWVDIEAALQDDGRPTRRPYQDCSIPDESATTTSNDMITGTLLGLQAAGDWASILRLYQYGEAHNWVMGYPEAYVSRVILRPNGITLLARVLHQLTNGEKDYAIRHSPVLYGPVTADYEIHLILLSRIIDQRTNRPQRGTEVVERIVANSAPLDALAQAVAGRLAQATLLLLSSEYEPPTYVRGHHNYKLVHWLLAARVVLDKSS